MAAAVVVVAAVLDTFGYTAHDLGEVHHGTGLSPTDVDHRRQRLLNLTR
ncbi:hypothetical protein BMS3Bbin02_01544 [bacterium BMS3Bbin02]|nr:hypothetical protein BMS3Bbin02_01544 [bacterium BMS3Bbin02]